MEDFNRRGKQQRGVRGQPRTPPAGFRPPKDVPRWCRAPGTNETASSRRGDQLRTRRCTRTPQGTNSVGQSIRS